MSSRFGVRYALSVTAADVGSRVSVRRNLPEGGLGDVVGELTAWTDGVLSVRRKDGSTVRISYDSLVAGKVVPARRVIARTAADVSAADLEEVAALGWQGLETERLGGWLLRAAEGWTGRANSVLPLGDPGLPVDAAIDAVADWYGRRGLTAQFQVPLPLAGELDAALAARGWIAPYGIGGIHLMVGDVAAALAVAGPPGPGPTVLLSDRPSPGWLGVYRYRGGPLPEVAQRVLLNTAAPVFAEVILDGATVATGRGAVDGGWLGITAMEVVEGARRRGLARLVLAALVRHGAALGARHLYLQVSADNTPAIPLYTSFGLTVHHDYHYRVSP